MHHGCYFLPLSRCTPRTVRNLAKDGSLNKMVFNSANSQSTHPHVEHIPIGKRSSPSVVVSKDTRRNFDYLKRKLRESDECETIIRNLVQEPLSTKQESKVLPERNARRTLQIALASYIIPFNYHAAWKLQTP